MNNSPSLLDRPISSLIRLNWETLVFAVLIVFAIVTRFYDLESRVMSHDESLHTYYSWELYQGRGFQHTPLMHGPLQFHLLAFSYFLFGASDLTARIPAVLFNIAAIAFLWNYRRYLGKHGTWIAALLFIISPYMLYYGRYVRNEPLITLFAVMNLWAVLRYFETGRPRYLYWLTLATVLHFTAKETSFIYAAQTLLFLGIVFLQRILSQRWEEERYRQYFVGALILAALFLAVAFGLGATGSNLPAATASDGVISPVVPGSENTTNTAGSLNGLVVLGALLGIGSGILALYTLIVGFGIPALRAERSFDLLMLLGTLVLPHLAAFPVEMVGWQSTDYSLTGLLRTSIFLIPITAIAVALGLWWNKRLWLGNTALFYAIFTVFYTTLFTNGLGFFSGLVGSLGYWLEQHGVYRGSQPGYYYILIQTPIYEYLPFLGSFLALLIGLRHAGKNAGAEVQSSNPENSLAPLDMRRFALIFFGYWTLTSYIAYTIAGEKMPWLMVHITLPMILLTGWALGHLVEGINWREWRTRNGWLILGTLLLFVFSLFGLLNLLLHNRLPFAGNELTQLQDTSIFLFSLLTLLLSGGGLYKLLASNWTWLEFTRLLTLSIFGFLGLLTARTAFTATYINYDQGNEYLVYAHGARGVKDVLDRVTQLSLRTTDGLGIEVAYDDDVSWPMTWYMRDFYKNRYYGNTPSRDLRSAPAIIVGDNNFSKIEGVVGQAYYRFDYIRMVWPNQDYFNLTPQRFLEALTRPDLRAAIFEIWLNRDFTAYGTATGREITISNWDPADRMRLYLRKDVANTLWEYGAAVAPAQVEADPYEGKQIPLEASIIFGSGGSAPGQFNKPRDLAVAPDGSLYIADSDNHRIQHFSPDGQFINQWGSFADLATGAAPGGTFNQPWGVAVGPDGNVYVSDTWNHRIQKFTADGKFISMWGYFGQAEAPDAFWGPRDIMVDAQGRVYVADTGNKRVALFDANGQPLTQFGLLGFAPGEFDEPVGLAVDEVGRVYVADTWNQRVQVFVENTPNNFAPLTEWQIAGWYGESLDNKPYLAVSGNDLLVSDPEGARILRFTLDGQFTHYWGDFGTGAGRFSLVNGIASDGRGGLWVLDVNNNRVMYFSVP